MCLLAYLFVVVEYSTFRACVIVCRAFMHVLLFGSSVTSGSAVITRFDVGVTSQFLMFVAVFV